MANDTTLSTTVAWRNEGLFGVKAGSGANNHLGNTMFTDVQTCMSACLETDGCEAISYARCGTTPLDSTTTTDNTACGPNLGAGDVNLAKECNLWSALPGTAVALNASPTGKPFDVEGTISTVFTREPVSNPGVFVVVEGVPKTARDFLPNCSFVAGSSACGQGNVNTCIAYEKTKTANACDTLNLVGFGSPTVTYAAALNATETHAASESKVGFVMDGAGRMYALMDEKMADKDGNVDIVSGPYTVPKRATTGERVNTYFTYLRAFTAASGANKGKLIVRVNGKELVVGQPDPGLAWYFIVLIVLGAILVTVLVVWGIHHLVTSSKRRRAEAMTALYSGTETLDFLAHPFRNSHK